MSALSGVRRVQCAGAHEAKLVQLMQLEIIALVNAVDDVGAGHYTRQQRGVLAGGLDTLAAALRDESAPVLITESGSEAGTGEPA